MATLDPTTVRLSPHFLLSDMVGCSSVYEKGHANPFNKTDGQDIRLTNGKALCENALEPILATAGPVSISYGFISPGLSNEIVRYQDPRKPSHHRWDLGAAVDICPHNWVQALSPGVTDTTSPIEFALRHCADLPLSRLITYSESPYFCVAVSESEVRQGSPRMAWYENRYQGKKGAKPDYRKYPSEATRERALARLEQDGFDVDWEGGGFPSYHGGGRRQMHHIRVSKYTMLTDWLYDREWVEDGVKNIPNMLDPAVKDAFRRVGELYDYLIEMTGFPRFSIVSGYTSPQSPGWLPDHDWRGDVIEFALIPPEYSSAADMRLSMIFGKLPKGVTFRDDPEWFILRITR